MPFPNKQARGNAQGQQLLAKEVESYLRKIPAVATEKELLAKGLLAQLAVQRNRVRSGEREHSIEERVR